MKSSLLVCRSRWTSALMVCCVAALLVPVAQANVVFTFDCDLEGWGGGSVALDHATNPGRVIQTYPSGDSFDPIFNRGGLSIDGSQLQEVAMLLEIDGWDGEYPISFFFFSSEGVTQIPVAQFGNGEHLIRFNAATQGTGNPAQIAWADSTNIHTIRLDMPDNVPYENVENGSVAIRWIAITDDPNFTPEEDTTDCDAVPYVGNEKAWFMPLGAEPTLDGEKEALWDNLPWIRTSDIITAAVPASADDLSAQFKAGYHGDSIYLFVEVTDDVAYGDAGDLPYERDSIEIYMDLPRVADALGDGNAQQAAWRNAGGPSQMRFQWDGGSRGFGPDEGNMTDDDNEFATNRVESTHKTYYEIKLNPPAALDLDSLDSFGFLLQVNDSDGADALNKPVIGWWGGPEQPWGQYNGEISVSVRPWQNSISLAEAGFTGPLELSVSISGPNHVALGQNAILQANVQHAIGAVSYQWYKDGDEIDGAVDPELMIVDAVEGDSGVYAVEVMDAEEHTATSGNHNLVVGAELPATGLLGLGLLSVLLLLSAGFLLRKQWQA